MKKRHSKYSHKIPLFFLLIILIGTLFPLTHCSRKTKISDINVVLISIDTLRADHLSCYGYGRNTSPAIDELAKGGVLFENAVSSTTWTLPAHAAMFTSLPDAIHSVLTTSSRLDPERITIQEIMKNQGYATAAFYSCPFLDPLFGLDQGFDLYESCMTTSSVYKNPDFLELGRKLKELSETPGFFRNRSLRSQAAEFRKQMQEMYEKGEFQARIDVTGEKVSDKAIQWLKEHSQEKFFLFLHYFDVHNDFVPPEPYDRQFDPDYAGSFDGKDFMVNDAISAAMDQRDLDHIIALYDGEIAYTDYQLNQVLETVKTLGLDENTLVVFTSDHGEEFFEHGEKGHRWNLYDTTLKIPLIFYFPGVIPSGKKIHSQVRIIDIFPTILDYAGIEEKGEALGESLQGLIEGAIQDMNLPALLQILVEPKNLYQKGLRTDHWKLIIEGDLLERNKRVFFFDLRKDAEEQMPLNVDWDSDISQHEELSKALALMKKISGEALSIEKNLPKSQETDPMEIPEEIRNRLLSLGYIQ
jgi:arylsulfatase A-like enzyme